MPYAADADIVELYGPDALTVADRDGDGIPDFGAVARALADAGDEIDSFLAVRYSLPLAATPGIVRRLCVDIAVYRLALSADVLTDEHRRRYEDALAHLKRLAKGEAVLPLPAEGEDSLTAGPRPVVTGGPARLFSRAELRDI